ncbi:hypothetical protein [Tenacibaculum xiamenense]|uniref:hypothetical protein n=1 Tax=Tenacibaculum xiamenense TaxID=1261553 RepID=UPI003894A689
MKTKSIFITLGLLMLSLIFYSFNYKNNNYNEPKTIKSSENPNIINVLVAYPSSYSEKERNYARDKFIHGWNLLEITKCPQNANIEILRIYIIGPTGGAHVQDDEDYQTPNSSYLPSDMELQIKAMQSGMLSAAKDKDCDDLDSLLIPTGLN